MPRRRAVAVLLAAVAAAACGGCGASSAPRAGPLPSGRVTIMQDDSVLTDPVHALDTLRSLGVNEVQLFISWHGFAPDPGSRARPSGFNASDPAAYPAANWAPIDTAVRDAAARGIGVYFLLTGEAPRWATRTPPAGTATGNPLKYEPSAHEFGSFVGAVGKRYDGSYTPSGSSMPLPGVHFWGIWNEPNYGYNLQPQTIGDVEAAPALYRGLLDHAWSALQATGHGHDTILIGETAPRGSIHPGVANGTVPLRFLRALYCADSSYRQLRAAAAAARACPTTAAASSGFRTAHPALFQATGFAAHLYTAGQVSSPGLRSPVSEPDYAGLTDLPHLEATLDRLNAIYGSQTKFPIYNTEFSFQTNPPKPQCGCVFLSPATAANYLNWSEYLMWRDRRVRSDSQYLLYDAPGPPGKVTTESTFASGLRFLTGIDKPGYGAFRLPLFMPVTSTSSGRSLQVWGEVRPAAFIAAGSASSPQVKIQFQPASGAGFTTLRTVRVTDAGGYFEVAVKFPASGAVRLLWTYPSGYAFLPGTTPRTVTSRTETIKFS